MLASELELTFMVTGGLRERKKTSTFKKVQVYVFRMASVDMAVLL